MTTNRKFGEFGVRGRSRTFGTPRPVLSAVLTDDPSDSARIAYFRGERDKELAAMHAIDGHETDEKSDRTPGASGTAAIMRQSHEHMAAMMESMALAYETPTSDTSSETGPGVT